MLQGAAPEVCSLPAIRVSAPEAVSNLNALAAEGLSPPFSLTAYIAPPSGDATRYDGLSTGAMPTNSVRAVSVSNP
jgi:hypothetical protein